MRANPSLHPTRYSGLRRFREPANSNLCRTALPQAVCKRTAMIQYLNTDLDLVAAHDLTALAADLEARGVQPLHVDRHEDGRWYATFEASETCEQPETSISLMLAIIESLGESASRIWWGCTIREFNIGYECGSEPWAFNQEISGSTLRRMANVGAALRITLYPPPAAGSAA